MKKVNKINSENCIETSSECVVLSIPFPYLGLCKGDTLTQFEVEIVEKLKAITGDDLATFDISALLEICSSKAPFEVNLLSILTLLRDNQICLRDYIKILESKISEITGISKTNVNLKCFAEFDSLGNSLGISREGLDQLIINELCTNKTAITSLTSNYITLKNQVDNININPIVQEPLFATCVDAAVKATSEQVKSIAQDYCLEKNAVGNVADISTTLSKIPATDNARYGLIPGWNVSPDSMADAVANLLLKISNLESSIIDIQTNCCAPTCDKIKIDFSMILDTGNDYIIRFRPTDGTIIPPDFVDAGSTVYFKDAFGVRYPSTGTLPIIVTSPLESGIYDLSSLTTSSPITVYVNAKVSNGSLQCDKCLSKTIDLQNNSCPVCVLQTSGTGTITVVYEIPDVIIS